MLNPHYSSTTARVSTKISALSRTTRLYDECQAILWEKKVKNTGVKLTPLELAQELCKIKSYATISTCLAVFLVSSHKPPYFTHNGTITSPKSLRHNVQALPQDHREIAIVDALSLPEP